MRKYQYSTLMYLDECPHHNCYYSHNVSAIVSTDFLQVSVIAGKLL